MRTKNDSEQIAKLKDEVREIDKTIDNYMFYLTNKEASREVKAVYNDKIKHEELRKKELIQEIKELLQKEKFT